MIAAKKLQLQERSNIFDVVLCTTKTKPIPTGIYTRQVICININQSKLTSGLAIPRDQDISFSTVIMLCAGEVAKKRQRAYLALKSAPANLC